MFLELTNTPRDYAWGSATGIAAFLGRPAQGGPEAELWFGTHPGSPARIVRTVPPTSGVATLAQWVAENPAQASGNARDTTLPILLKILAADSPLSLQVHPTPSQAAAGFAAEEASGIPRDDPARNYRDPYSKPEIIVSVSDRFEALSGFRPAHEVAELMADLDVNSIDDAQPLRTLLADPTRVIDALTWLLSGDPRVSACVAGITAFAETPVAASTPLASTYATITELAAHYPQDAGVIVAALMNRVSLRRGECLYAPAGVLHAYLNGVGIELMTASDNVVRGGLTPKHIDTPELTQLLSSAQGPAHLLDPIGIGPGATSYRPPAPFKLDLFEPGRASIATSVLRPAIALVDGAEICLESDDAAITLTRGGAAFIPANTGILHISGRGRVWIASAL
ncbi:mannose-6-phosphate isomerase, class I [Microbacterium candidum]|uniref:mannose-6-phosphate isomerase n=1 Tax=Microbacterium candidum TaxID=3041922 RepID=A0ABT7MW66_9MICO|nr:mannose-6-phosphate isomerase, class I [Microbacterium sp. ASV49]MDL9978700.1 mannose-6-phosphate isomerase, class I [Microbacterium sp. ASV49]